MSQWIEGELRDRWLVHKNEPLELNYMDRGEELRVVRLKR